MDNKAWAQGVAKKIKEKEIEVIKRSVNKVPYIAKNGVFDDLSETRLGWWTNGFWGGMMWQLYQAIKRLQKILRRRWILYYLILA